MRKFKKVLSFVLTLVRLCLFLCIMPLLLCVSIPFAFIGLFFAVFLWILEGEFGFYLDLPLFMLTIPFKTLYNIFVDLYWCLIDLCSVM